LIEIRKGAGALWKFPSHPHFYCLLTLKIFKGGYAGMIQLDKRKPQRGGSSVRSRAGMVGTLATTLGLLSATSAFADQGGRWVSTWGQPAVTTAQAPSDQTIREIQRISVGGNWLRVRLSNEFNSAAINVGEAHVALAGSAGSIHSDRKLTFGGQSSIVIPPNAAIYSDPAELTTPTNGSVAVSLFLPTNSGMVTIHPAAIDTAYITNGNTTGASSAGGATKSAMRYMLSELQVFAADNAAAIATLGDSITEGVDSTEDASHRWPDFLADRLAVARGIAPRGVNNAGIGGNRVLNDNPPNPYSNFGQGALARLDRDVLAQGHVKFLIVLEGVNDLGLPGFVGVPQQTVTADQLIGAYRQIIARAHEHDIKVIGGTITPFAGALEPNYWSPAGEAIREAANNFILKGGEFDGTIDFAAAVADPKKPTFLAAQFNGGDGLHLSDAGYQAMANAIDLRLFKDPGEMTERY
jgi:lysophospholipase L1-like esterase